MRGVSRRDRPPVRQINSTGEKKMEDGIEYAERKCRNNEGSSHEGPLHQIYIDLL